MKKLPIGQNEVALVDNEDYPVLSRFYWRCKTRRRDGDKRAVTQINRNGKLIEVAIHQIILGGRTQMIDHRDGNPLNNQKSNLRECTRAENMHNRKIQIHSSKFKGVSANPTSRKSPWVARIRLNNHKIHLGSFASERLAAQVYDSAAERLFGKFARTNKQMGAL